MTQLTVSDLHEVIEQLRISEEYPSVAIELIKANWEQAAPLLVEALQGDIEVLLKELPAPEADNGTTDEDAEFPEFDDLLLQSAYLFGQFRHAPAYPVMLQILDLPLQIGILGDFQFEGLPRCIAACANGDASGLRTVLNDVDADESARVVAWDALLCMVAWGDLPVEAILGDLEARLGDPAESENEFLVDVLVNSAARLPVSDACLAVARKIATGARKGGGIVALKEFDAEREGFQPEGWREQLLKIECPRLEDAAAEIEPWFAEQEEDGLDEDGYDADGNWVPPEPVEQLKSDKVGRNDPCICGSGNKYKKCCGKNA
ncbi:MAG: DUF1186 domain-containing protein [Fibrobacteres bacterium]|jgi:hypothetical protein|nr:DUF1186 domain-containing protein [Fibrobacterota bacterium]